MPAIHQGSHEAMKCRWRFYLNDPQLAPAEASTIFRELGEELERLERELSRFRDGSDLYRINHLKAGQRTHVMAAAWDCLSLARDFTEESDGAFDISAGPWIELYRQCARHSTLPPPRAIEHLRAAVGPAAWSLEDEGHRQWVICHHDELLLDLGGVGKGYALDQLACRLEVEHGLSNYLLTSGESTILAHGRSPKEDGWPINAGQERILLKDQALSTSGADVQGAHIIDPRSGEALALNRSTVHALAPQASVADALSTASFVLTPKQADALVARHEGLGLIQPH